MKNGSTNISTFFVLLFTAALGACGGGDSEEDSPQGSEAAADRRALGTPGDCGGLSLDAAADVLDVEASRLVEDRDSTDELCVIHARGDMGKALVFSVTWLDSAAEAGELLESMAEDLGTLTGVEARSGVGDAAYQAGPRFSRLLFHENNALVDLIEPTDPDLQREAAAAIAAEL
ncbi:MAG: hypothetical protein QNJ11_11260 [Woeseiaceae bacterium]|nr:hypothetical protein [Woeseiaceae bacterium]